MLSKEVLVEELTRPYGEELIKGPGWRKDWVANNENILGWSRKEEHLALYNAARIGLGDVLEIGCFLGRSTVHLAAGLKVSGRNNVVHVIDPFFESFKVMYDDPAANADNPIKHGTVLTGLKNTFSDNVKKCGVHDKISIHHSYSHEIHGKFRDDSLGALFIDGNHTYEWVKKDFELYFPKVKENGLVLFHDSIPEYKYEGIVRYMKELDAYDRIERITNVISLTIYRKVVARK